MFQENHNPFGIGDVVIAKYTPGPGRPYWPGKVLSATGTYFWRTCQLRRDYHRDVVICLGVSVKIKIFFENS